MDTLNGSSLRFCVPSKYLWRDWTLFIYLFRKVSFHPPKCGPRWPSTILILIPQSSGLWFCQGNFVFQSQPFVFSFRLGHDLFLSWFDWVLWAIHPHVSRRLQRAPWQPLKVTFKPVSEQFSYWFNWYMFGSRMVMYNRLEDEKHSQLLAYQHRKPCFGRPQWHISSSFLLSDDVLRNRRDPQRRTA